jgi:hypothetical protein
MVNFDGNLGLGVLRWLGGPNLCRVGRAGSQFYFVVCSSLMHAVTCRESLSSFMFTLVVSCWLSRGDVESSVSVSPLTCAHTQLKQKKLHLLTE